MAMMLTSVCSSSTEPLAQHRSNLTTDATVRPQTSCAPVECRWPFQIELIRQILDLGDGHEGLYV